MAKGPGHVKKQRNSGKVSRPRSRKMKGNSVSKFNDFPFDVLLEIFKLLEPVDLLNLSRVSNRLHGLLGSDNMVSLWKSVCFLHFLSYGCN
jgi:hypothetical protein